MTAVATAPPAERPPPAASPPPPPPRRLGARALRLGAESALVVLSVLLGLALGEWRERVRERELAERALANFRTEIAANLATVERAQPKHAELARRLGRAADSAGATGDAFASFVAVMPDGGLDTAPLRGVAWETAQTTGALRLLDYETAALLSETYLVQRAALEPTLQRLADRLMHPENFEPGSRRAMLRTHGIVLAELSGQETYLMGIYRRALARLSPR